MTGPKRGARLAPLNTTTSEREIKSQYEVSKQPKKRRMTKPTPIYNVHEPLYKFKSLADSDDYEIIPFIKKPNPPYDDQSGELSFIKMLFHYEGTVLKLIWPQMVFQIMLVLLCILYCTHFGVDDLELPDDVMEFHKITGSITGFLLVFRTTLAYDRYYEGRKLSGRILNATREMTSQSYVFITKSGLTERQGGEFRQMQEEMRRLSILLWGTMRHSLRESKLGFHPNTNGPPSFYQQYLGGARDHSKDKFPFAEHWHRDSCRPLIASVMTIDEFDKLSTLSPDARPSAVMTQMRILSQRMGFYVNDPTSFSLNFMESSKEVIDLLKTANRIVTTPMPFAYSHMLSSLVFLFTFITPLLYCGPLETGNGWISSLALTFCAYGLLEIGICLENPFGWDTMDLDLEAFGKSMALESDVIAVSAREELHLSCAGDHVEVHLPTEPSTETANEADQTRGKTRRLSLIPFEETQMLAEAAAAGQTNGTIGLPGVNGKKSPLHNKWRRSTRTARPVPDAHRGEDVEE
ncbi:hypothetical protein TrVE_jg5011 [Triparma verrucosa]|uniref:Uncharacterized protein n=1 Tax=Triparma verrucosa TaxID=1606542 RepID=A0A9W7ESC9_9STRA|nr:hypothetical protein TrVE_jg5011 [Triparma verrucosa]